jgi:glutamate 5-kinase
MLYSSRPSGEIKVDDGARAALMRGGSLLPSGVVGVSGSFKAGDVVRVVDAQGVSFARGIVNHSADDVKRIMGTQSREIEKLLNRKCRCEVVYHGNMVFT